MGSYNFMSKIFSLNPNIQIKEDFNTEGSFIVSVIYKNGRKSYRINAVVNNIISLIEGPMTVDDIIERVIDVMKMDGEQLGGLIKDQLIANNILLSEGTNTKKVKSDSSPLKLRKVLIPAKTVNQLAAPLTWLFSLTVAIPVLTLSLTINLYMIFKFLTGNVTDILSETSAVESLWIMAIVFISLLFHELGHAAAAYKHGCRNVNLGIGWYIYFIVFFADLSEAWSLSRRERLLIDFAGAYFQSISLTIIYSLYILFDSAALFAACALVSLYNVINLNPFFRMDGYWVASSLLNIDNLRGKATQVTSVLVRSPIKSVKYFKQLKKDMQVTNKIVAYALSMLVFNIWFLFFIFISLLPNTLSVLITTIQIFSVENDLAQHTYSMIQFVLHILVLYFIVKFSIAGIMRLKLVFMSLLLNRK